MPTAPAPAAARPRAPILTPGERYGRCEAIVVRLEGGYSNNPKDPGGATNMGVTLRALEAHRGHPCTAADVRALSPAEVRDIYAETYWPAVMGDQLPPGVDLITFDAAVNCGRGRAATFLQLALGFIGDDVDGDIGPATLRRLAAVNDLAPLVERIRLARLAYYKGLSTFPTFGTGWLNRLHTVAQTSAAWALR